MQIKIQKMPVEQGCQARTGYRRRPTHIVVYCSQNRTAGTGAYYHALYLQRGGSTHRDSWHYAVDDQLIVQSIPDNEQAWYLGDTAYGTEERKAISIRICENEDSDFSKTLLQAAALTVQLMHTYHIPLNCVRQKRKGMQIPACIWKSFIRSVREIQQKAVKRKAKYHQEKTWLFTVQIGLFREEKQAEELAQLLRQAGFPALVSMKPIQKKGGKIT